MLPVLMKKLRIFRNSLLNIQCKCGSRDVIKTFIPSGQTLQISQGYAYAAVKYGHSKKTCNACGHEWED